MAGSVSGRRLALASGALGVATLLVFAQVRHHDFVDWDDPSLITTNPVVVGGLTAEGVREAWTGTPHWGNWIPLTVLSLMANVSAHGLDAPGILLTNVAIHALAALALLLALVRMTGALGPSLFVAGVFALHPLHVESVAWATERKDVLCGLFWMLTLLAWARYAEAPTAGRYAAVAMATAAALLSKPMAVTLPCVLLLLDYWPLDRWRDARRCVLEKLPLLGMVAVVAGITFLAQEPTMQLGERVALPQRVANAIDSYAAYLGQTFWPTRLAYFYPHPEAGLPPGRVAVGAAVLLALTGLALHQARRRPWGLVGWLWYLGTLVPVIGLVQVGSQARADRYTYLPMVGIAIAVAWAAREAAGARRERRLALAGVAAVVLLALGLTAHRQVAVWRDSVTLRSHAVAVRPPDAVLEAGLAGALVSAGRTEEALAHLDEAIRLEPSWTPARLMRAKGRMRVGRVEEAIADYRAILTTEPGNARARANLGLALARSGRPREARAELERAVAQPRPGDVAPERWARVHLGLARLLAAAGEGEAARSARSRALALDPSLAAEAPPAGAGTPQAQ